MADKKKKEVPKQEQVSLKEYLDEAVANTKGRYYPVKASLLKRLLVKKTSIGKLHPNPDDEFCYPDIGPNYAIISDYEAKFRKDQILKTEGFEQGGIHEPLMVQKSRPDGYLIMNGHHRWAAAYRCGFDTMKIEIVNLTQGKDIRKMLMRSRSDKRVTLDLDEVVFGKEGETALEKPLSFPLNRIYRDRVRQGVPALFNFLNNQGYDIWVYTASLRSMDDIRYYFKFWGVRLTGIVTGVGHKGGPDDALKDEELKQLAEARYKSTTHIDSNMVLRTFSGSRECEEFPLSGSSETWGREVIDILAKIREKEKLQPVQ